MTSALVEINLQREVKSFDTLFDKRCEEKRKVDSSTRLNLTICMATNAVFDLYRVPK